MSLTSVNRPEFIPSFSVKVEALQEKERIMFIAVRLAFPEEGQVFLYTFIQIADALSQFLIETFGNHFFVMARHLVQHHSWRWIMLCSTSFSSSSPSGVMTKHPVPG